MRDMLEKNRVVTHGDVVEQHEVLMDLAHVADVRHQGSPNLHAIRLTVRNSGTPAKRVQSAWTK